MRKLINSIIACTVILLNTGCSKWLDVKPSDQINSASLFEDAEGFRNALNGIYKGMSANSLYGRDLTWGVNSVLAQDYVQSNLTYNLMWFQEYTYDEYQPVADQVAAMWSSGYNVIANANKLISEVEKKDSTFFPRGEAEKKLILGESIAARALMHFEMLRLFAPAPIKDVNGKYIPYQDIYPSKSATPLSTKDVLARIISDLQEAQNLVAVNDTISTQNRQSLSYGYSSLLMGQYASKGGLFFNFRGHRLNYIAIHALLARVYMYANDRINAKKEAEHVYKLFGPNGRPNWLSFTAEYQYFGSNMVPKFANDVIFASYNSDLFAKIVEYKGPATFKLSDDVKNLYFIPGERDYRQSFFDLNSLISIKWKETPFNGQWSNGSAMNAIMPVIRLSEIYYIYSECLFEENEKTAALRVLNEIRIARGRSYNFTSTNPNDYYTELLNEYHREFLEEGQTIFAHKRLNRDIISDGYNITMDEKVVFPIPLSEKNF